MIVYQVLTRLFKDGTFDSFDSRTFDYLKSLGISHIWYTGIPRHATAEPFVKGNPGSPYAVMDWFDVNPYLLRAETAGCEAEQKRLRLDEFGKLVERTHEAGMKVIIDFIPNHVARNCINPIPRHDHCDYDWTDTLKIRYPEATEAMADVIRFWTGFGVDGFRCDMVEMVPYSLWRRIRREFPGILLIGEAYDPSNYLPLLDAGFDFLYDKTGMYDILRGIIRGTRTCRDISANWQRLGPLQRRMLNFLENHDEQRIASPRFAGSKEKGYAALAVSALFYDCPFMLYFGQECGEDAADGAEGRTSIFEWARRIDPVADEYYRTVLNLASSLEGCSNYDLCYMQNSADGFDGAKHFAFLRFKGAKTYLFLCNFSDCAADLTLALPGGVGRHDRVRLHAPARRAVGLLVAEEGAADGSFVRVL